MTQEIKVGVSAKTGGVDRELKSTTDATEQLAQAVGEVDKQSRKAAESLGKVEAIARRLKEVQKILSREMGAPIDAADATIFLNNFERMRRGRTAGTTRVRGYDNFESWYAGHSSGYRTPADAARHRRYILSLGMQQTGHQSANPPPLPPVPPPPGHPGGPSPFQGAVRRAQTSAMSFGKGVLALAGIQGVMSMAGSAIDMATEEATGIDTLKRRMGDLGKSFEDLRDQARMAGNGLGITFLESGRLAQQFLDAAGNSGRFNLQHDIRTSAGFARAFGLDPIESTQFFGTMRRVGGMGTSEQESRRFALMIAEAIEKGGYTAKADEVLKAVADFSTQAAHLTLTSPNVEGFAGTLAALTKSGMPGLDPSGAAGILSTADAAIRRGGGFGEAGRNFTFAALSRYSPDMDPIAAEALFSGGIFGTTRNMFGPGSAMGAWAQRRGVSVPPLNDVTNLQKLRELMRDQYGGNPWFELESTKNLFGLSSLQQASALMDVKQEDLTGAENLLSRSGLGLKNLSASGLQGLVRVAGAGRSDLEGIYQSTMGRKDLSDAERQMLVKARAGGDTEVIREALAKIIAQHDQESTDGSLIRKSVADLKDELTRIGGELLPAINLIRDAVVGMAMRFAPAEYQRKIADQQYAGVDFEAEAKKHIAAGGYNHLESSMRQATRRFDTASKGGKFDFDKVFPRPNRLDYTTEAAYFNEMAAWTAMKRRHSERYSQAGTAPAMPGASEVAMPVPPAPGGKAGAPSGDDATLLAAAGGDPQKVAMMKLLLGAEGSGANSVSPKGARGRFQFMPGTWSQFGEGDFSNASDFSKASGAASRMIDWIKRRYNTNDPRVIAAYYNGGDPAARAVLAGKEPPAKETRDYLARISGEIGNTPLPPNAPNAQGAGGNVTVGVTGEVTVPVTDQNGAQRGVATLRPYIMKAPSGGTRPEGAVAR